MWPTIKKGEQVVGVSKTHKRIRAGDVLVFRQKYGDSILVHRCMFHIKTKNTKYYITKGDAGLNFDPLVQEERVYGVVPIENSRKLRDVYFRKIQYVLLPVNILVTLVIRVYMLWNYLLNRK